MPDLETVKDLFGIPVGSKSSTDHSDDNYGDLNTNKSVSFDEKVDEVRSLVNSHKEEVKEIKQVSEPKANNDIKGTLKKSIIDANKSDIREKNGQNEAKDSEENKEVLTSDSETADEVFDSLEPTEEFDATEEETEESEATEEATEEGEKDIKEIAMEETVKSDESEGIKNKNLVAEKGITNLDDWNLISPSPKFNQFYAEKANVVKHLLKNQERLNFEPLMEELSNAHVDATIPIFDQSAIHEKMQEVQGWRNRVKQVQMTCNKQHFKWKMALELLKGLLARVEYIKPAVKQEGVIFEHLADVCMYCSDLEALYDSADKVSRNLDNAFVTLSRQLSIAMPERPLERKGEGPNLTHERDGASGFKPKNFKSNKTEEVPENLKNFDSLVDSDNTVKQEGIKKDSSSVADTSWDDLV